jgi:flagellar basal-body rod protein FlgB
MAMQDLTLMSAMLKKMDWHEERQKIIAQNIANADSVGYRPMDMKPLDFKQILGGSTSSLSMSVAGSNGGAMSMAATNSTHFGAENMAGSGQKLPSVKQKDVYEVAPAGNAVVLEDQLLRMNENYTDHAFVSNLYQKNLAMLKMALK